MISYTPHHRPCGNHGGFVLIFSLVILLTLTFLGFMATRTAVTESTLSGNERVQRETFSLADGGTETAIMLLKDNLDCPTGFPQYVLDNGVGAMRFTASADFTGEESKNMFLKQLPSGIRAQLPPIHDANQDILRQACIANEGVVTAVGAGGCDPLAADAGAPHTNILYDPDPAGGGAIYAPGENANATGGATGSGFDASHGGTQKDLGVFSQHVAYRPSGGVNRITRESIIRIEWRQVLESVNNCRW
ncbi:MAG: hypothetical protein LBU39_10945 [Desulfobulbaceae bacterium]|jgi:hypothetical protein|nr:hypothetical protein [Desulfobulbaceae bacterium]